VELREASLRDTLVGGKYLLGGVIGKGGMGVVYEAVHRELRAPCAVKVVHQRRGDSAESKRLVREARTLARLSGQHSVRVLDAGRLADGSPYLVMERLTGEPLSARLTRQGPLPVSETLNLARQMCEAIHEAHSRGIIHRDLKPSNVFLVADECVKVVDFGLAMPLGGFGQDSMATSSEFAGSPSYMSPEQIRASAEVTASTDIWSLGVVIFEMLTGRLPFTGANKGAILASIVADPAARLREVLPDAPPELDRLIADCLEKSPAARPIDAAAVQARLDAIAVDPEATPIPTAALACSVAEASDSTVADSISPAAVRPLARASRTRWFIAATALLVAAVLGVGLVRGLERSRRTPHEPPRREPTPDVLPAEMDSTKTIAPTTTGTPGAATPPLKSAGSAPAAKVNLTKTRTVRRNTNADVLEAISTRH
jgi:serine/threonine-protein kinase